LAKAKFTKLVFTRHRRSHFIGGLFNSHQLWSIIAQSRQVFALCRASTYIS
jgi:hypothetical protein